MRHRTFPACTLSDRKETKRLDLRDPLPRPASGSFPLPSHASTPIAPPPDSRAYTRCFRPVEDLAIYSARLPQTARFQRHVALQPLTRPRPAESWALCVLAFRLPSPSENPKLRPSYQAA